MSGSSPIGIISEIGQVIGYRDNWGLKCEHNGFIAKLTGKIVTPLLTDGEADAGYGTIWAKDIDEAIELIESGKPTEYGQDFEKLRELIFLNEVKASGFFK